MRTSPRTIYLDHSATTPLDPRVLEAMMPVLTSDFGNASSVHGLGRKARVLVEDARARVADRLGADSAEIVFTSGGTESDNAAIRGTSSGRTVITNTAEHEAVLRTVEAIREAGGSAVILAVDAAGRLSESVLSDTLSRCAPDTVVSVMLVNNETGARNDVPGLSAAVHASGGIIHTDAVQAAGFQDLNVDRLGVDLMTLSGHKFYGPKGTGVLYVRSGTQVSSSMTGGLQERGRRAGTENVAGIVGLAAALDLAAKEMPDRVAHIGSLQCRLVAGIKQTISESVVFNTPDDVKGRAPHIVNIAFPPVDGQVWDGEMLILGLDIEGICVSSGSACTSGAVQPSHVLLAMGRDEMTAQAAIRFSIGRTNTEEDIDTAVDRLDQVARRVRDSASTHPAVSNAHG